MSKKKSQCKLHVLLVGYRGSHAQGILSSFYRNVGVVIAEELGVWCGPQRPSKAFSLRHTRMIRTDSYHLHCWTTSCRLMVPPIHLNFIYTFFATFLQFVIFIRPKDAMILFFNHQIIILSINLYTYLQYCYHH